MTIDDLIQESRELESEVAKIQRGEKVGLASAKIRELVDRYDTWYVECLAILPDELKDRFRKEYEGTWYSSGIKAFLDDPAKVSVLRTFADDKPQTQQSLPYWQNPYDTAFRSRIRSQRSILMEAKALPVSTHAPPDPVAIVELLARRLPNVARQLSQRHANRPTLTISDEYDVQDLFHALLQVFFEDIRPEEWVPSYAGGSSRMDFLLKPEQVVVEMKKTRAGLAAKEAGDQLAADIMRYRSHQDCKSLVAVVYDPDRIIQNPRGLESDLSTTVDGLLVRVFIVPS